MFLSFILLGFRLAYAIQCTILLYILKYYHVESVHCLCIFCIWLKLIASHHQQFIRPFINYYYWKFESREQHFFFAFFFIFLSLSLFLNSLLWWMNFDVPTMQYTFLLESWLCKSFCVFFLFLPFLPSLDRGYCIAGPVRIGE